MEIISKPAAALWPEMKPIPRNLISNLQGSLLNSVTAKKQTVYYMRPKTAKKNWPVKRGYIGNGPALVYYAGPLVTAWALGSSVR
jgi:hypothetical protein